MKQFTQGWIPVEDRDADQIKLTQEFNERARTFGEVGTYLDDTPDRVILAEIETKVTGAPLPRIWQQTGSCVGAAGARSYGASICSDIYMRGDVEAAKIPFPYSTYGVGRKIGGMRRPGDGSFGAAQAKAVETFGMLPWDSNLCPKPRIKNGWATWTSGQERAWSHPSAWPEAYDAVEAESNKYKMGTVTQIKTTADQVQLLAQGYGVTLASSFGTRKAIVRGDVSIADWNGRWAHQMSCTGYWRHPSHGLIFQIDNQWGAKSHPQCPTLAKFGVNGSFWIKDATMTQIIRSGEVFGHSNTDGFPSRDIWGTLGL